MSFGTVLVANRGEIAIRVLRAARAAGLRTVAVYSDVDRASPHVREADTAVRIGPAPAAESYLSIPALLEAARRTGADAIHPGYGFLSERAEFARAVREAGLTFIGPPAEVIELMGRKDAARDVAVRADVPVVPAAEVSDDLASIVGFPLLVKAAAGGGGKGMRIVRTPEELPAALSSARREAQSAFGDDTLLLERYVDGGRHVEVQVLADAHGTVLHLFERDCSVQRRHQKVLEEAPASTIGAKARDTLLTSAVALAREVGYVNAGTVEFLVAGERDSEEVFFLEMNTRLQVEHPVTEAVTGLDLVQLQLLVAQGRPLPITQEDVVVDGHAIEARVYAEDPYAGFLPQAGVATTVAWPDNARVDAALESGQAVGTNYDPMLGKIIVHRATRESARQALLQALDDTAVLGLTTNVGFLRQLAGSEEYRDGAIHTGWLDEHLERFRHERPAEALCIAAWALAVATASTDASHPFGLADGWRSAGPPADVPVELDGVVLRVNRQAGRVSTEGEEWQVRPVAAGVGLVRLEIDGVIHETRVEIDPHEVVVGYRGQPEAFARPDAFGPGASPAVSDGTVAAPMPGTVLAVSAVEGDEVVTGDTLGVMEAMKMEVALTAPRDGIVTSVGAIVGDQVALGQTLFVVDPAKAQ
jgi:3-methylcrotonyl-CoA carboxylase alpha subunit/acetyl-CoA/propionyl-CoA carboxylase biotin carboxyl carrier protein